eukprot:363196-Chlamydomonas_euryale.AAC.1
MPYAQKSAKICLRHLLQLLMFSKAFFTQSETSLRLGQAKGDWACKASLSLSLRAGTLPDAHTGLAHQRIQRISGHHPHHCGSKISYEAAILALATSLLIRARLRFVVFGGLRKGGGGGGARAPGPTPGQQLPDVRPLAHPSCWDAVMVGGTLQASALRRVVRTAPRAARAAVLAEPVGRHWTAVVVARRPWQ